MDKRTGNRIIESETGDREGRPYGVDRCNQVIGVDD